MRTLITLLFLALAAAPARADVRPAGPTMVLVVKRQSYPAAALSKARKLIAKAINAGLPKRFKVRLITEGTSSWPRFTAPHPRRRADAMLARLEDQPVGKCELTRMLSYARSGWSSGDKPRHHLVVMVESPPAKGELDRDLHALVDRGFTISFIFGKKVDKALRKDLQLRGAGRVHVVKKLPALRKVLAKELRWNKLSKKDKKRLAAAVAAKVAKKAPKLTRHGKLGVIRTTIGRSKKRYTGYVKKRFYRSEAVVGGDLAISLRKVRCPGKGPCDIAGIRRAMLAKGKSLLGCLQKAKVIVKGNELLEVEIGEKPTTPEGRCVASWKGKLGLNNPRATVLIAHAKAVR